MTTLSIRVPDSLHRAIKELATKDGYSMNQFLITAAAEKLSALDTVDYLRQRAERANLKDFDNLLARVPDAAADPGDELPPKHRRRIGSRGVISSPVPHHPAYGSVQGGSNQLP
jgi:predicted transcriptional regulator